MSAKSEAQAEAQKNRRESMAGGAEAAAPATAAPAADRSQEGRTRSKNSAVIEVVRIEADPTQPRKIFDDAELADLAASIKDRGLLSPVGVRWDEPAQVYRLIFGERRLRAVKLLGLTTIAATVMPPGMTETDILLAQIDENERRENLSPIETARGYWRARKALGLNQRDFAAKMGMSQSRITKWERLLELPEVIQAMIEAGEIEPATALEVGRYNAPPEAQIEFAKESAEEGLTRDETAARRVEREETDREKRSAAGGEAGNPRSSSPASPRPKRKPTGPWTLKHQGVALVTVTPLRAAKTLPPQTVLEALEAALEKARADALKAEQAEGEQGGGKGGSKGGRRGESRGLNGKNPKSTPKSKASKPKPEPAEVGA